MSASSCSHCCVFRCYKSSETWPDSQSSYARSIFGPGRRGAAAAAASPSNYHCTGFKGRCGNTWSRADNLSELFADVVKRIEISNEDAEWITEALRESQDDKQKFHRASGRRASGT